MLNLILTVPTGYKFNIQIRKIIRFDINLIFYEEFVLCEDN